METNTAQSSAPTEPNASGLPTPATPEHAWLRQLLGEWTFESQCAGEPGQEPQRFHGRETVHALGELWVVGQGVGETPGGGNADMMITLGFDPKRKRFVGTWCGSMMSHLWVYEGELDTSGKILKLIAHGPSFTDPEKTTRYEDSIEIVSEDHRILRSKTEGVGGEWMQFMEAHYRRRN